MLKLDNNFIIKSDDYNITLVEISESTAITDGKERKKGEKYQTETIFGNYNNVPRAICAYIDLMISRKIQTSDFTVSEIIQEITEFKQHILNINK